MTEKNVLEEMIIGRIPVLDRKQQIHAYSIFFRWPENGTISPDSPPTRDAAALIGMVSAMGVKKILGDFPGFFHLDSEDIKNDLARALPKEHFVLVLPIEGFQEPEILEKIENLKTQGYRFATDAAGIAALEPRTREKIFLLISYLFFDTSKTAISDLSMQVKSFSGRGPSLIAKGVNTAEALGKISAAGFDFFQGLYFASPVMVRTQKLEPAHLAVIRLIRIIQSNMEIQHIEDEFKKLPDITIALLKFINSASIFTRNRITSIRQAITLIGYQKLLQWLLMMSYASGGGDRKNNPLFRLAVQRAKAMEILTPVSSRNSPQLLPDEAFFIGLLSLLDVLFNVPMEDILTEINAGEDVWSAISKHEGPAGKLLELLQKVERDDIATPGELLGALNLKLSDVQLAMISGFWWAESMNES